MLLEYLHEEIARPVRLNETDYVVTQALADFIRYEKRLAFDGIAFRSVQREGGTNYVLFDRGVSDAIIAPDWRPTFYLVTSPAHVSQHVIKSVRYVHD
ncbi:RES family NAD+ phosphorylase [Xanthomonas medicagonis]|uniref:RES family NAD+ phosphorylase n=1 Tax=Xanthomonas medicagonis TaxID=3160841 RepID=UPI0035174449